MDPEQGQGGDVGSPSPPPQAPTSAYTYSNLRKLLRQNSEKIGMYAEDFVLPSSQRSVKKRSPGPAISGNEVETIDLQASANQQVSPPPMSEPPPYAPTTVAITVPTSKDEKAKLEAEEVKPEHKFPYFMVIISVLQVALFYFFGDTVLLLFFGYDPYRRHELWRYFTIMFAHSSQSHLWGNVIFQLILGVLLEIVHHWKRIAIIYMASVLGGSLLITAVSSTFYGVGASAGVYGLLFAHLSTIILNWNEMGCKFCRLFWLLGYIGLDIWVNSYVKFSLKIDTNTSHAGHIGGAITGFLVAIIVLRNLVSHSWEVKLQKLCAGILLSCFVVICLVNISWPSHYFDTKWNFQYLHSYFEHILKFIRDQPEMSEIKMECNRDEACKQALDQYTYNGTLPEDIDW